MCDDLRLKNSEVSLPGESAHSDLHPMGKPWCITWR